MARHNTRTALALGGALGLLSLLLLSGCGSPDAGRVVGGTVSLDGPYALGQNLRILSPRGQLVVRGGSSATQVTAAFTPFVDDAPSSDEGAQAITDSLTYVVDTSGNTIVVSVSIAAGALAGLGADIAVGLPSSFNGGIELEQHDGSVDAELVGTPSYTTIDSTGGAVSVKSAAGQLDVTVGVGDCTLGVAGWSPSDGVVDVTSGQLAFAAGAGLSGNIDAEAGSAVVGPSPLPSDWSETVLSDSHKSYLFGADAAQMGTVSLTAPAAAAVITITEQP